MFNKIINRLNLPRYMEIVVGVMLIIGLTIRYSSHAHPQSKSLLAYVIPYEPVVFLATIVLLLAAARLIAGKPKDYSSFFFKISMRLAAKRNMVSGKRE